MDLSGIRALSAHEVSKILREMSDPKLCPNILAIHLNELGANTSHCVEEALSENYRIKASHELQADHRGGLYLGLTTYLEKVRGQDYIMKQADKLKYVDVLKKTIEQNPKANQQHNILNAIHMKMISRFKAQKNSGFFSNHYGIGRTTHQGHCSDFFTL